MFQLRGAQILDAIRLHKNGYPESMNFGEFWRRFRTLSDDPKMFTIQPGLGEIRGCVEELLINLDLDKSAARLGNTQVREKALEYIS